MLELLKDLTPFTSPLVAVIFGWRNINSQRKQQLIQAKNAILNAIESTEGYLRHQQEGGQRITKREETLVNLWRTAGSKLEEVAKTPEERTLVERLRLKARAWEDTEQWPQTRVDEAKIGFESVKAELLSIFKPEGDSSQDVIAALILEELEDEQRWQRSFAQSSPALIRLAEEALAEYRAGLTQPLDPETL